MATLLDGSTSLPIGSDHRPTTLLVMTSEQPLCGSFNPNVLTFAERRWQALREAGDAHLVVVGRWSDPIGREVEPSSRVAIARKTTSW
jgi:F0F1-type ATP synthase gamma subunit